MAKFEGDNRSAVWGGVTIGLIVGLVLWLIYGDSGKMLWAIIIGGIIGLAAELLGKLGDGTRK